MAKHGLPTLVSLLVSSGGDDTRPGNAGIKESPSVERSSREEVHLDEACNAGELGTDVLSMASAILKNLSQHPGNRTRMYQVRHLRLRGSAGHRSHLVHEASLSFATCDHLTLHSTTHLPCLTGGASDQSGSCGRETGDLNLARCSSKRCQRRLCGRITHRRGGESG